MAEQPILSPETLQLGFAGKLEPIKQAKFDELQRRGTIPEKNTFVGDITEAATEWLASVGKGAKNIVTGEATTEFPEIEEIPNSLRSAIIPGKGQVGMMMSLGRDDLRKTDIFRQTFGNVDAVLDKFGNSIVTLDDSFSKRFGVPAGKYYLNKPGASPQDVDDIMTTALGELYFARLGGKLGSKIAGKTGKILGTGGGAGAGAVAQDLAAGQAGSDRGIDPQAALIATAFGVGGELASEIVLPFVTKFIKNKMFVSQNGLTKDGRKALQNAGLDPDEMTPAFLARFEELSQTAVDPAQAARLAAAESLPQPVNLTQGDVARTRAAQSAEDEILSRDDTAGRIMSGTRVRQQGQLAQNVPLIAEEIAPTGRAVDSPTDAMIDVGAEISNKAAAAKLRVDRLYKVARGRGKTSVLDPQAVRAETDQIRNAVYENGFDLLNFPKAANVISDLEKITKKKTLTVNDLESWRQRATKSAVGEDASAVREVINQYDNFVDRLLDDLVEAGDADAFAPWLKARRTNKSFRENFSDNNIIAKIVDNENPLEPSEQFNLLFTLSAAGKSNSARTVRNLKGILSEEGFNRLKQGAFLRVVEQAEKAAAGEAGVKTFSGAAFKTALVNLKRRTPELFNALFTAQDKALLNQFANVAELATTAVPGAKNYSGSAAPIIRSMERVFGPQLAAIANRLIAVPVGTYRAGKAQVMSSGGIEQRGVPAGIGGGIFATGGQSELGDTRRVTINPNQR